MWSKQNMNNRPTLRINTKCIRPTFQVSKTGTPGLHLNKHKKSIRASFQVSKTVSQVVLDPTGPHRSLSCLDETIAHKPKAGQYPLHLKTSQWLRMGHSEQPHEAVTVRHLIKFQIFWLSLQLTLGFVLFFHAIHPFVYLQVTSRQRRSSTPSQQSCHWKFVYVAPKSMQY